MAEFWSPTGLQHARTGMDGRALPVRAPRRRPPRTTGLGSISRNDHGRRGVRDHRCRRLPASRSRRLTRRYSLDRCSSPQRVAGGGTNPYTRNGRAGKAGRHFADRCLKGASNGCSSDPGDREGWPRFPPEAGAAAVMRRTVLVLVVVLLLVVASVLPTGFVVACSRRNHRSSAGSVDPAAPVSDLGGSV
jgi:hypothetical protein